MNQNKRYPDLPVTILLSSFEKDYLFRQVIDGKKFYTSCSLEGILKRFIIHSSEFRQLSSNDLFVIKECVTEWANKEMKESEKPEKQKSLFSGCKFILQLVNFYGMTAIITGIHCPSSPEAQEFPVLA